MPNAILDPTGKVGTKTATLAARPARVRGATVGLLATTKQNADLFLEEVGALLEREHGVSGVVARRKTSVAETASQDLVDDIAAQCDVVVTGVGDCGSCSASAIADAVIFENRSIPSAVIISDAFIATSDEMAKLQGAPGYGYVTTPHPVASLTHEEVRERAARALPEVMALLTGAGSAGSAGSTAAAASAG